MQGEKLAKTALIPGERNPEFGRAKKHITEMDVYLMCRIAHELATVTGYNAQDDEYDTDVIMQLVIANKEEHCDRSEVYKNNRELKEDLSFNNNDSSSVVETKTG
ncbi:MAG TPA: hypothetical protein VHY08_06680 [Bacillota bacterium]|nr:hypothetical protein [Bacillota bacterium]